MIPILDQFGKICGKNLKDFRDHFLINLGCVLVKDWEVRLGNRYLYGIAFFYLIIDGTDTWIDDVLFALFLLLFQINPASRRRRLAGLI